MFLRNLFIGAKGPEVPLALSNRAKFLLNLIVGPKGEELPLKLIYRAQ